MEPYVVAPYLRAYLHLFAASVSAASCDAGEVGGDVCRDEEAALRLKIVAVAAILVAGAAGVAIPLVGRRWRGGVAAGGGGSTFVLAMAFAAGVILATGFVHMMHDAEEKFQDPCLQDSPWRRFPFAGSHAMLASLVTLVVDFLGTQFYQRKQREAAPPPPPQRAPKMRRRRRCWRTGGIQGARSVKERCTTATATRTRTRRARPKLVRWLFPGYEHSGYPSNARPT